VQLNCEATIWKDNGIFFGSVRQAIIQKERSESEASLHDQQMLLKMMAE
jgi:hypothetical protein